jgi:hypothetical protein
VAYVIQYLSDRPIIFDANVFGRHQAAYGSLAIRKQPASNSLVLGREKRQQSLNFVIRQAF